MYSIGTVALMFGVCVKTVRRWNNKGMIACIRTPGGHRRFPVQEIRRILKKSEEGSDTIPSLASKERKCAIYGRVSSHKQYKRGDLERQVLQLKEHAQEQGLNLYRVYKDVASGLNATRKGLWKLLHDARKGCFSSVLLTYKDRLTRFGYVYLKQYLAEFNVSLTYLHELDEKSPESEMVEDLVAIIHSFSGKLYGLRSGKKSRKKREKNR